MSIQELLIFSIIFLYHNENVHNPDPTGGGLDYSGSIINNTVVIQISMDEKIFWLLILVEKWCYMALKFTVVDLWVSNQTNQMHIILLYLFLSSIWSRNWLKLGNWSFDRPPRTKWPREWKAPRIARPDYLIFHAGRFPPPIFLFFCAKHIPLCSLLLPQLITHPWLPSVTPLRSHATMKDPT